MSVRLEVPYKAATGIAPVDISTSRHGRVMRLMRLNGFLVPTALLLYRRTLSVELRSKHKCWSFQCNMWGNYFYERRVSSLGEPAQVHMTYEGLFCSTGCFREYHMPEREG